jgi:hypothetical protein
VAIDQAGRRRVEALLAKHLGGFTVGTLDKLGPYDVEVPVADGVSRVIYLEDTPRRTREVGR